MFDNHTYDLMMQVVEEHKSLWRIKEMYKKDSSECGECLAFWKKLEKDKEERIKELQELIKNHIC